MAKVANIHKVPKKMWSKWSEGARTVFNAVMLELRPEMQWAYKHPKAALLPDEHWQTTRWNAACAAAEAVDGNHIEVVAEAA